MPHLILLTGASGHIGSRLLRRLEEDGCPVRCLARDPRRVAPGRASTQVVAGDCLDEASLDAALRGVDQAYYLVHSMASGAAFAERDRDAATNFGRAAARAGVRRIVYLGGLGAGDADLSTHLKSRLETGDALRSAGVPVVEFRASVVVGAGSLSFEMIRALVERLPVMICPRWVKTCTQPIAIDDVLAYLEAALDLPAGRDGVFEIGGPDVVSYGDMLREYAKLRGLRRLLIPVPVLTPRLSGLWLGLVTPAQARVGRALVAGLRNPTVVRSSMARDTFDVNPMPLREAFTRAIDEASGTHLRIDGGARSLIRQTASFDPRVWAGRLYWFGVLPLHALVFRGLLRSIARRAVQDAAHIQPATPATFRYQSIVDAPASEVFRWHEQPGALAALTPAALVRIEQQEGGIRDGAHVAVSIGIGPARVRWTLRHHGYIADRQFCDEQVAGPFASWRHTHLFHHMGPAHTLYEDRIEFAVSRYRLLNRIAVAALRPLLTIAFARRHHVVRAAVGRARLHTVSRRTAAAGIVALVAAATLRVVSAQTSSPPQVRTVPFVDLERYAGEWFEIARFPNRFQKKCVAEVRATYSRRPDGRLDVVNRCRTDDGQTEARGVARIVDEQTFAKLEVRFAPGWLSFLPAVWGDYWVIGLAPDYSWAVVGDPGRDYLWILARVPRLDDEALATARAVAKDNGFDIARLVPTRQES